MPPDVLPPLAPWAEFYVIVGTAGATLTGLMFVVLTLTVEARRRRTGDQVGTFATPTVVHFCAPLLIAGTLTAPWHRLASLAVALTVYGVAGVAYAAFVAWRARRQHDYHPVLEDWLLHAVLPFCAYGTLLGAGLALTRRTEASLFAVGAAALGLLFVGIHNSWDTLTYFATQGGLDDGAPDGAGAGDAGRRDADPPAQSR